MRFRKRTFAALLTKLLWKPTGHTQWFNSSRPAEQARSSRREVRNEPQLPQSETTCESRSHVHAVWFTSSHRTFLAGTDRSRATGTAVEADSDSSAASLSP